MMLCGLACVFVMDRLGLLHIIYDSKKIETQVSTKEEKSQQLANQIQTMQGAMQKAAVEAAKAVAAAKG